MNTRATMVLVLALLGCFSDGIPAPQRARHAVKKEESPVTVTRSATLQVAINSDATQIFSYLSDPQKLTTWFPDQAIIEQQLGGKYHFRWTGTEGMWSGVVTEFIRGNTLAYTWQPPDELYETNVRFKLFPQGAQTLVDLTHSGFTSSESLEKAVEAWDFYLRNLKSVVEQGIDMREQIRRTPGRRKRQSPGD